MFGTKSLNAIKLIEKTLNVRTISIKKDVYDYVTRKYKKVFDKEETLIALDKQRQLNDCLIVFILYTPNLPLSTNFND